VRADEQCEQRGGTPVIEHKFEQRSDPPSLGDPRLHPFSASSINVCFRPEADVSLATKQCGDCVQSILIAMKFRRMRG